MSHETSEAEKASGLPEDTSPLTVSLMSRPLLLSAWKKVSGHEHRAEAAVCF